MPELKTEPAFALPRVRRPWWVALVIGGVSTGAGIAAALGLAGTQGRAAEPPPVRTSGIAQQQTEAEWRSEVTRSLQDLRERMARIEGRLERR